MTASNILCRWGHHSWAFEAMSDSRTIDIPGHIFTVCTLTERCRRCYLKRVTKGATPPKRPRVPTANHETRTL